MHGRKYSFHGYRPAQEEEGEEEGEELEVLLMQLLKHTENNNFSVTQFMWQLAASKSKNGKQLWISCDLHTYYHKI